MYTDGHVSTKYHWARPHVLSPESTATITWDIPEGTPSGEAGQIGWQQPLRAHMEYVAHMDVTAVLPCMHEACGHIFGHGGCELSSSGRLGLQCSRHMVACMLCMDACMYGTIPA